MSAALLEGQALGKSFGGLQVLKAIDFQVAQGEILALVGPNGAGKTTLFNMVSGLVRPTCGHLRLDGQSLRGLKPAQIARLGVGRTFQTPRPFQDLTVAENVRTAVAFSQGRQSVADLLDLVHLRDVEARPAAQLPTLGRKRLELAMALASSPKLLLLDEILGGLTPPEAREITTLLRHVRDQRGTTLFWIDHVMWAVMETATRVVVIHHGEVLCEGRPHEVARDARVIEAYLGKGAHQDFGPRTRNPNEQLGK